VSKHVIQFLDDLKANFRLKRFDDDEAEKRWVQSMIIELRGFSPEVLEQASANIRRTRKNEYFPMLSECLAACAEAKRFLDGKQPKLNLDGSPKKRVTFEQLANDMLKTQMAKRAAQEGWILGFYRYIERNGRMPEEAIVPRLRQEARDFDRELDDCRAGRGGFFGRDLARYGETILAFRNHLIDRVLHGVTK